MKKNRRNSFLLDSNLRIFTLRLSLEKVFFLHTCTCARVRVFILEHEIYFILSYASRMKVYLALTRNRAWCNTADIEFNSLSFIQAVLVLRLLRKGRFVVYV